MCYNILKIQMNVRDYGMLFVFNLKLTRNEIETKVYLEHFVAK